MSFKLIYLPIYLSTYLSIRLERQVNPSDNIIGICHGLNGPDLQSVKEYLRPSPSTLYLDNIIKYFIQYQKTSKAAFTGTKC